MSLYAPVLTLGSPIPDKPHAVSVCMPEWQHVIGYEEGKPEIHNVLQCGYPRFVYHPLYRQLCQNLIQHHAANGETALAFPSRRIAEKALAYIGAGRVIIKENYAAVIFPESLAKKGKEFWQHAGFIISSRQAEDILSNTPAPQNSSVYTDLQKSIAHFQELPVTDCYVYPSGMAAIFEAYEIITALHPEKATIQLGFPYLDTLKIQQRFGKPSLYIPYNTPEDLNRLEEALTEFSVSAVFCEVPSNPLLHTMDFAALKKILQQHNVALVIDDTIATAYNVDIRPYADIIVTSLTKFYSGVGNVCAGSLFLNPESTFYNALKTHLGDVYENVLYPRDAVTLLENSTHFSDRMPVINQNASALAAFLQQHPAIATVCHPSITDTVFYDAIRKNKGGYGGLLSFILKNPEDAPHVYNALHVSKGPSLGTAYTLACPYTLLAHYTELEWAAESLVPAHLLRVSVGTEPFEYLRDIFAAALENLNLNLT